MNQKFQPGEEMFDDVEGHGRKGPGIAPAEGEDVQGHGYRGPIVADEEDDTEGHGSRLPLTSDDEDVAGHGAKFKFAVPQESIEDDTEGHGRRGPIAAEEHTETDTDGHRWRMSALPDGDASVD